MKLKIKGISWKSENKAGEPYRSKDGKPFTIANINVGEDAYDHPDFKGYVSYFDTDGSSNDWVEGTVLEGTIVENVKGDMTFFNFRKPSGLDLLTERVNQMEDRIAAIETVLMVNGKTQDKEEEVDEDFDAEDLPF